MTARIGPNKEVTLEYYPTHSLVCNREDFYHHPLPEVMARFIDDKLAEKNTTNCCL